MYNRFFPPTDYAMMLIVLPLVLYIIHAKHLVSSQPSPPSLVINTSYIGDVIDLYYETIMPCNMVSTHAKEMRGGQ